MSVERASLYCHSQYMAAGKQERLQIRVDPDDKRLLERAAQTRHQSLSAFVLHAAAMAAEDALAERRVLHLEGDVAQAFSEALARPATVNPRLAAALERSRRLDWVD